MAIFNVDEKLLTSALLKKLAISLLCLRSAIIKFKIPS